LNVEVNITYILRNNNVSKLIGVVVIATLLAMNLLITEAATIRVPEDYGNIQDAVNHASSGDIIIVRAGVYEGFTVSKSLVILGESNESVVVKGGIEIRANNVKLNSIKIVLSEESNSQIAVRVLGNNTVLGGVIIESYKYGVQLGDVDHKISGFVVEYSRIVSEDISIYGSCSDLSVFYSEIVSKSKQAIVGCGVLDLEFNNIIGDTAVSTSFWYRGSVVKYNNITGKATGLYIDGSENTISDNRITSSGTGVLLKGGQNIVENNVISGSSSGILITLSNNVVIKNIVESGDHAIDLNGNGNLITNNTLTGGRGVHATNAYGNTISFNLIDRTGNIGVYLSKYTGDNLVYGNTFWYCYNYEGVDESGKNQWYFENETYKLGNYWSYNKALDNDGDGITDEPYHIATTLNLEILDKYPLAKPIVIPQQTPTTTTQSSTSSTTWTSTTTITQTSSEYTTSTETTQETTTTSSNNTPIIIAVVIALILIVGLILLRKRK
jgi:parallel beta-helix repeat protein